MAPPGGRFRGTAPSALRPPAVGGRTAGAGMPAPPPGCCTPRSHWTERCWCSAAAAPPGRMRTSAPCWWESGSAAGSRCGAPPHFPPWRRRRRWAAPSLFAEAWRGRGYGSSAHSAATPTRRGRGGCTGTAAFGRPQTPTPMRNPQRRPTTAGTDFGPHTPQRPPPAAISTAPALSALGPMGRRAAASGAMGCSSVSAPPSPHGAAPGAAAAGGCADWPILMSDRESSQRSAGGRSSVPLPARGRGFALPVCGCRAVVGALHPVGGASVGGAWRAAQPDHGKV